MGLRGLLLVLPSNLGEAQDWVFALTEFAVTITYPETVYYRKPLPEERVGELLTVDWFAKVAGPADAAQLALSPEWEDFRLERRNELTAFVAVRLQQRGSEWNKCARAFREFFDSHISMTITARLAGAALPDTLLGIRPMGHHQLCAGAELFRRSSACVLPESLAHLSARASALRMAR